jgi:hypothetical protein
MFSQRLKCALQNGPVVSRVIRPRHKRSRALLTWERFEDRTLPSTLLWTGGAGDNNWDSAANWVDSNNPGVQRVPNGSDSAIIDNTYTDVSHITITVSRTDAVNTLSSQAAILISGSLSLANSSTVYNALTVWGNGTLNTSSSLNVSGLLTWRDFARLTGGGVIDAQGGMSLIGLNQSAALDGGTLENEGTATWGGYLPMLHGAVFDNRPGATFVSRGGIVGQYFDPSTNQFTFGDCTFKNEGTFSQNTDATTTVYGPFNNSGAVDIEQGGLDLLRAGVSPGFLTTGTFHGAAGTSLNLGFQNMAATATIDGDIISIAGQVPCPFSASGGTYVLNGTSFTNATTNVGNFLQLGQGTASFQTGHPIATGNLTVFGSGTLTGTDSFVVHGLLTWDDFGVIRNGNMNGTMTVDVYGGMTLANLNQAAALDGVTLNNHQGSTATWNSGYLPMVHGAVFNNLPGATFIAAIQGIGRVGQYFDRSTNQFIFGDCAFNNQGNFVQNTDADATTTVYGPFNNSGVVDIEQGALDLRGGATNSGMVSVAPGTTIFEARYTQTAGATTLNSGTVTGGSININNGSALSGSGAINATVTNGGQVIPGGTGAAGTLRINGSYIQTATGALGIDLGGTTAGTQYDQLTVSGTATLGGTFSVASINGFQPAFGNTFQVVTFGARSGNLATFNGLNLGGGLFLNPVFNATSLRLDIAQGTGTTVSSDHNPSDFGQAVTFTATVTNTSTNGVGAPTGVVQFVIDGSNYGSPVNLAAVGGNSSTAAITDAALSVSGSPHSVFAVYTNSDGNYLGSNGTLTGGQTVNADATSTAVSSNLNPSDFGQSVTFTATVTNASTNGGGTPTGAVQFTIDGTNFGAAATLVNGSVSSAAISTLPAGNHVITAIYTPADANFDTGTGTLAGGQTANFSEMAVLTVIDNTPSGGSVTLPTTSSTGMDTAVQAVNTASPSGPVTVTLDLGGSTTNPATAIGAPSGVTVELASSSGTATVQGATVTSGTVVVAASVAPSMWTVNGGNVTVEGSATAGDFIVNGGTVTLADRTVLTGNSPALIVHGGQVILHGVTATTATASPTILVTGGNLLVRGSTIQESTGSAQAAILITGGSVDLGTASSHGGNTFNINGTGTLIQNTSGSPVPAVGDTFNNNGTTIATNFGIVTLAAASPQSANQGVPKPFNAGALIDTPGDSQSWSVDVNWGDGTPHTDFAATATGPLSTPSHSFALPGTYTVTVTTTDPSSGPAALLWDLVQSFTVSVAPSIFVLNSTASGALTLSGSASINIPGAVVVDSKSVSAISASGNTQLKPAVIDVTGGVQQTGKATVSPAPTTGVSLSDPLAGLAPPNPTGLHSYGSVNLTAGTLTICPGIYSQINVSGDATLTLTSTPTNGTYIIEGGGLTVTGSASVIGQNVFIYNAGSNYPASGGNFGGTTVTGTGSVNLSAAPTGTYAGILIFQSAQNTRALSFSGSAMLGMSGVIYAPSALLTMSGSAQLQNPLVVGMLNLSGNAGLAQTAAGDGTGDSPLFPGELLAGNLTVYVDSSSGSFTADELARIQDAITGWDALLIPYSVTITEVNDPALANLVVSAGTTSASGGVASGVLGCYDAATSTITMIEGWSWYAGADTTAIGPDQYDFQTTVTHELGHALGLGGSTDPSSPMFETLAAGATHRIVTTQDLNIPDPPSGADPLTAGGFPTLPASTSVTYAHQIVPIAAATSNIAVWVAPPGAFGPPITVGLVPATIPAPTLVTVLAASSIPDGRARPVPTSSVSATVSPPASSLQIAGDANPAPPSDVFTDPGDLRCELPPAPVEATPHGTGTRVLLSTWDQAIDAYIAEGDAPARYSADEAGSLAIASDPPASPLDSALLAGTAVALWGAWEVRSRKDERRSYLEIPS